MNITKILMLSLVACVSVPNIYSFTPNEKLIVAYAATESLVKFINKTCQIIREKNTQQPENQCPIVTKGDIGEIALKSLGKSLAIHLTIKNHTPSDVILLHLVMQYCPLIHEWLKKDTTIQTAIECFVSSVLPPIIFLYLPNTKRD